MRQAGKETFIWCIDFIVLGAVLAVGVVVFGGCTGQNSYSSRSIYPADIGSVYVEMFNSESFRRGSEYDFTDALAKRIESQTPYKVVSSRDRADSVISGQIVSAGQTSLTAERETGRTLENEVLLSAVVSWKNLKTGELLIDSTSVSASASYSQWQSQSYEYGSILAANNLAERIVELMEKQW